MAVLHLLPLTTGSSAICLATAKPGNHRGISTCNANLTPSAAKCNAAYQGFGWPEATPALCHANARAGSGATGRLRYVNVSPLRRDIACAMPAIIFRCPNTKLNVHGWIVDDPAVKDSDQFEAIACTACTRVHLVNPKTGKVLGADDER